MSTGMLRMGSLMAYGPKYLPYSGLPKVLLKIPQTS